MPVPRIYFYPADVSLHQAIIPKAKELLTGKTIPSDLPKKGLTAGPGLPAPHILQELNKSLPIFLLIDLEQEKVALANAQMLFQDRQPEVVKVTFYEQLREKQAESLTLCEYLLKTLSLFEDKTTTSYHEVTGYLLLLASILNHNITGYRFNHQDYQKVKANIAFTERWISLMEFQHLPHIHDSQFEQLRSRFTQEFITLQLKLNSVTEEKRLLPEELAFHLEQKNVRAKYKQREKRYQAKVVSYPHSHFSFIPDPTAIDALLAELLAPIPEARQIIFYPNHPMGNAFLFSVQYDVAARHLRILNVSTAPNDPAQYILLKTLQERLAAQAEYTVQLYACAADFPKEGANSATYSYTLSRTTARISLKDFDIIPSLLQPNFEYIMRRDMHWEPLPNITWVDFRRLAMAMLLKKDSIAISIHPRLIRAKLYGRFKDAVNSVMKKLNTTSYGQAMRRATAGPEVEDFELLCKAFSSLLLTDPDSNPLDEPTEKKETPLYWAVKRDNPAYALRLFETQKVSLSDKVKAAYQELPETAAIRQDARLKRYFA